MNHIKRCPCRYMTATPNSVLPSYGAALECRALAALAARVCVGMLPCCPLSGCAALHTPHACACASNCRGLLLLLVLHSHPQHHQQLQQRWAAWLPVRLLRSLRSALPRTPRQNLHCVLSSSLQVVAAAAASPPPPAQVGCLAAWLPGCPFGCSASAHAAPKTCLMLSLPCRWRWLLLLLSHHHLQQQHRWGCPCCSSFRARRVKTCRSRP